MKVKIIAIVSTILLLPTLVAAGDISNLYSKENNPGAIHFKKAGEFAQEKRALSNDVVKHIGDKAWNAQFEKKRIELESEFLTEMKLATAAFAEEKKENVERGALTYALDSFVQGCVSKNPDKDCEPLLTKALANIEGKWNNPPDIFVLQSEQSICDFYYKGGKYSDAMSCFRKIYEHYNKTHDSCNTNPVIGALNSAVKLNDLASIAAYKKIAEWCETNNNDKPANRPMKLILQASGEYDMQYGKLPVKNNNNPAAQMPGPFPMQEIISPDRQSFIRDVTAGAEEFYSGDEKMADQVFSEMRKKADPETLKFIEQRDAGIKEKRKKEASELTDLKLKDPNVAKAQLSRISNLPMGSTKEMVIEQLGTSGRMEGKSLIVPLYAGDKIFITGQGAMAPRIGVSFKFDDAGKLIEISAATFVKTWTVRN